MDEQQTIKALKDGDTAAFSSLVAGYQHLVYRTALNMLQHETDAEDVTQEVFMTVFKSVKNFRGDAGIATWLYRIAINQCLEWQRKKTRKKRFAWLLPLDEVRDNALPAQTSPTSHPGVKLENKERAAILFAAINKLPEQQKVAFLLAHAEQLSYGEIAAVMETTVSSVESLLVRAKKRLRTLLHNYYQENEMYKTNK